MSIFQDYVDLLLKEMPLSGDTVLIGRQIVYKGCEIAGVPVHTDVELFKALGASTVRALDVSDYEGAEIIHDLNLPLPAHLHGVADFVFDGSCLDNIFDVANALRCFSKLLRPNGRIMIVEHGTSMHSAIIMFSPEWFFNYFAANDYDDCQITLFAFPMKKRMKGRWRKIEWQCYTDAGIPIGTTPSDLDSSIGDFLNVVIARKGADSTDDKSPVQAQYRVWHGTEEDKYLTAHRRFLKARKS